MTYDQTTEVVAVLGAGGATGFAMARAGGGEDFSATRLTSTAA
jgi:hypothetical protein